MNLQSNSLIYCSSSGPPPFPFTFELPLDSLSPTLPATADQTEFANLLPYPPPPAEELVEVVRTLLVFPFSNFPLPPSVPFTVVILLLEPPEEEGEFDETVVVEEVCAGTSFSIPPPPPLLLFEDLESREEDRLSLIAAVVVGSETLIVDAAEAREEDLERVDGTDEEAETSDPSSSPRGGSDSIEVSGVVDGSEELDSFEPFEDWLDPPCSFRSITASSSSKCVTVS